LKSPIPLGFKEHPVTLGEHLKKARLSRGILQREIAQHIGVSQFTYIWWERDRYLPRNSHWKPIVEFLGYYPILEPISELNWILAVRRQLGLSKKKMAQILGIDEVTYAKIENNQKVDISNRKYKDVLLYLKRLRPL